MKIDKKPLLTVVCLLLLVVSTVFVTLAWLTDTNNVITNTFTVGDISISLTETPVDADGNATTGARVTENTYKLFPGKEYDKDPTIFLSESSEECYLFIKVDNQLGDVLDTADLAQQLTQNGWTLVDGESNIYQYRTTASGGDQVVIIETIKIVESATDADLQAVSDKQLVINAYAIQAEGFDTSAEAWSVLSEELGYDSGSGEQEDESSTSSEIIPDDDDTGYYPTPEEPTRVPDDDDLGETTTSSGSIIDPDDDF